MNHLGLFEAKIDVVDFVKVPQSESSFCERQYFHLIQEKGCMAGVRFLGAGVGWRFDDGIPHLNDYYCQQATRTCL